MMREIIDVPRLFMRHVNRGWLINWRSQSAGGDTAGGEQLVRAGFPVVEAELQMVLPQAMLPYWAALRDRGRGRANAYRLRIVDRLSWSLEGSGDWHSQWDAYLAGQYVEPRPQVAAASAVAAGATSITVDERALRAPIRLGWMSYNDWPFRVVARSGSGAAVVLTVERLAVAIPSGGLIDVAARAVVVPTSDTTGIADYEARRAASFGLSVREWLTR